MLSRSSFLRLGVASLLLPPVLRYPARAAEHDPTRDMIFNDPEAPTAGNADGDITIVDFFDYNCPFCKKAAASLERLVAADGRIRLIYKDWPILEDTSLSGAQLALGARYQDRYLAAHHALMNIPGYGIAEEAMRAAVGRAGVDMKRLDADMKSHAEAILQLLRRNVALADAIGFQGTPGFLIGKFRVNQALTYEAFERAVADARAYGKGK
jgi:protein-disulfide isomerase